MRNRTKLCILGITGSIGTQTVAIAKKLGYSIVACSFHHNISLGKKIVKDNKIPYYFCSSDSKSGNCQSFDQLLKKGKPNLVVNAIIGFAGLRGTLAALHNNIDLALANKESIVTAGWYILPYAKKHNLKVIPIDSEHTNLYWQLLNQKNKTVNQVYITCSGGKYLNKPKSLTSKVTWDEAISHKNWKMGNKITIDSNTLVNKCFEVIEAYYYCHTKKVSVLLDPTSIIHSAIMLSGGEFIYTNSKPVMTSPIAMAVSNFQYEIPKELSANPLTNVLIKMNDIRPIKWAYDVMNDKTHSLGIIINASNEVAIKLFAAKMLRFDQITDYIENSMKRIKRQNIKNPEEIYEFDKYVRLASIKYWK